MSNNVKRSLYIDDTQILAKCVKVGNSESASIITTTTTYQLGSNDNSIKIKYVYEPDKVLVYYSPMSNK
jgi:hypothetical protein